MKNNACLSKLNKEERAAQNPDSRMYSLKGYCTVFQHALKLLELTGIDLTCRMSKTARKNLKGLKSYKEFKF